MTEPSPAGPRLSILIPVRNEVGNIESLVAEIERACAALAPFELIYVDDGSTDGTAAALAAARRGRPWLRVLSHPHGAGKSRAMHTGVGAAAGPVVAMLDGDGQNDPAFIPALVAALEAGGPKVGLAQGQRVGRKDGRLKALQSRIANGVRVRILRDDTRDTGCGLKVFRAEAYRALPTFDGLHRFMPALMARAGYGVVHRDVVDRPRLTGLSKYGLFDRLWVGLLDLAGVWWLIRRGGPAPEAAETPAPTAGEA